MLRKVLYLLFFVLIVLSNPVQAGTWVQVNSDGFDGIASNEGARAMAIYNNLLYVGSGKRPLTVRF